MSSWINGDFNYDGVIDGSDYTPIDNAFNTHGSPLTTAATPAQPTGLTIVQSITGEIDMQWNPSPDPNVTYNVYAGTDPTFVPNARSQLATGLSENGYSDYFDTDPSLTWYYKVTAVNTSGAESSASATIGASMPSDTPDDYVDSPPLYSLPDGTIDDDAEIAPAVNPLNDPPVPPTNLFAFYGAGDDTVFGNVQFGQEPTDGVAAPSIVQPLGGTQRPDHTPYTDWQMNAALQDLCTSLDTSNDHVISSGEINAETIKVIGYSWGAVEATNFTRMLAVPNAHLLGERFTVPDIGHQTHIVSTGGYNLTGETPVSVLVTIDPVLHAIVGLSGLLKTTDGPLLNVANFRNYYGNTSPVCNKSASTARVR